MDADSWSSRLSFASRSYKSALQSRSGGTKWDGFDAEMLMGFEEIDVADDDVREEYPCPFCADYFDIVGLCCHIDDEHPVEAKNGVCPVCAVRAGVDMVAHITLQHGNIFKMQRKRKSRKVSSHSTLSLLRRELREGNLQSLFGGSSCIVPSSSAAPDPLLSSFILPMAEDYGNPRSHPSAAVVAVKKSTGEIAAERLRKNGSDGKPTGIVHLKISSFRESKSDDKRFYIFTATKTLHLRTALKKERAAWIEALSSTRNLFQLRPLNDNLFPLPDVSISTERLKKRLRDEGISDGLVNDCEQIMLSEFSAVQGQLKFLWEERSNLLDTLRQFEASTGEAEASGVHDGEYQLIKNEYSSIGRAKYSEWSTTESSDDVEKQELEEVFDEEEVNYYDTHEDFVEPANGCCTVREKSMENQMHGVDTIERRKKLPDPVEKEKGVSLWSMIKDNVGKDLTRVCLPVYFNEPISTLQKCFEDLEYSHLLDQAYQHGAAGNSLLRILYVAAFAVSGYSSTEGRNCKPFNPLLGETYEADYPELGMRFFAEKVSHHPTLLACHCEGRGWKFWGDSNLKSKFWGRSIQLDPVGTLTLEFDDGEIFQWNKVTTSIYNLILGKLYCDHHGIMHIHSNREYSCKLKFKEQSLLERNPHQVHGFVEDGKGKKIATLFGKWNESMHFIEGEVNNRPKDMSSTSLLWKRNMPPENLTRYNLTSFAITLNELTPGLKEKLPPTDSRLRPDQRYLENGEYDKANSEKLRLETRQRMSRKLQEHGWKPRWFKRDGEDGTFRYTGGYWEARERGTWDECPTIFGEISEDLLNSAEAS